MVLPLPVFSCKMSNKIFIRNLKPFHRIDVSMTHKISPRVYRAGCQRILPICVTSGDSRSTYYRTVGICIRITRRIIDVVPRAPRAAPRAPCLPPDHRELTHVDKRKRLLTSGPGHFTTNYINIFLLVLAYTYFK